MASEKMQQHLEDVNANSKFNEVKEIKEQETGTDSKLGQLALEIDISATKEKSEGKTDAFTKIDTLFATLEKSPDKKQLALQYALESVGLEIGEGSESKVVGLKDVIAFFNKAVKQKEEGSWMLTMDLNDSSLSEDEKAIGGKFKDIIDNPNKHSALAYLIQRSSAEIVNLEAAKGYGEETRRNEAERVKADMYLGNQTRNALSALESWIDSDLSESSENENYLRSLTTEIIQHKGYIDVSLKNKLESDEDNGINPDVKRFWKENVGEGKEYVRRYPHSTNFAIMKADGTVSGGSESENVGEFVEDEDREQNILDLEAKYGCKIKVEDVEGGKKYTIKRGSENMNFIYQDTEKCFSFQTEGGNTSFSITMEESPGNGEGISSPYDNALDKSVKIGSEVCRILTKVKNNHLDLDHFELSSDDKTLQADYCMRFRDSNSWNPLVHNNLFKNNYDGLRDINVLENIEETLGLDASTFCSYMNESFTDRKGKKAPVEVHKIDDTHFQLESHGQSITFLKRSSDTFVFKTKKGTELTIKGDQEHAQQCAAIINYIVSIIKNNGEELDYFEKDGSSLQADYKGRYFDVDLIDNTQETMGVDSQVLTNFMNSYRSEVGI